MDVRLCRYLPDMLSSSIVSSHPLHSSAWSLRGDSPEVHPLECRLCGIHMGLAGSTMSLCPEFELKRDRIVMTPEISQRTCQPRVLPGRDYRAARFNPARTAGAPRFGFLHGANSSLHIISLVDCVVRSSAAVPDLPCIPCWLHFRTTHLLTCNAKLLGFSGLSRQKLGCTGDQICADVI